MSVFRFPRASGLAAPGVAVVSTSCRHLLCNVHHCMSNPERSSAMRLCGVAWGGGADDQDGDLTDTVTVMVA